MSYRIIVNGTRKASNEHADLVLVTVHTRQRTDVSEDVLQGVSQLERVDVAKAELNVSIDDQLGKTEDFAAQMERISEAGLLTLFCGEGSARHNQARSKTRDDGSVLHGLEIHVVVKMQVIQILGSVDRVRNDISMPYGCHTFRCIKRFSMLYPCRQTCRPASTQSNLVVWKNFVALSCLKRFFFVMAFSGRVCNSFKTKHFSNF